MMRDFIQQLGFDGFLVNANDVPKQYPDYEDITKIGVHQIYFSEGKPCVLFMSVSTFDETALSAIAQVQHNAWNYHRVMLLYVTSDTEIRIYNCFDVPNRRQSTAETTKRLGELQLYASKIDEDLTLLSRLFSRIGIDSGTLWTDEQVQMASRLRHSQRVDAYLIKSMTESAKRLMANGLPQNVIHALLIRSLFILFLEDKGAAKEAGLYESIKSGANSYFDLLKDKEATYCLFKRLQQQFNGNITVLVADEEQLVNDEHLSVIRDCFFDGNLDHEGELFEPERLFNFEIINIGLISEIYENFLGEMRSKRGQFYTPFSLADMILSKVLPTNSDEYDYPVLDPACGSGIFLVESYKRLIKRWKKAHHSETISFETLVNLLQHNIYGIEIDETAIRVTAFSLYLALIDNLDPRTLWNAADCHLPYLIYNPDDPTLAQKPGRNLWCRDTVAQVNADAFPDVKLVVGNPPYGTKDIPSEIKEYCRRCGFANEYVLPFMHKAVQFCPDGEIAMVFTSKVLFNTSGTYERFRQWLFGENRVERVDNLSIFRKASASYGGSLFSGATCPVCVAYYKHGCPDENATIKYCSPKTFVKSNVVDGLVIDDSDITMLPIGDVRMPYTKIWKVAAWGNYYGYRLIQRYAANNLGTYLQRNHWIVGRGVNADSQHPDFIPSPIIEPNQLTRYCTDLSAAQQNTERYFRQIRTELFEPPFVAFKQGQHNGEIACALFNERVYFTTMAFALNGGSIEDKKILTAYLNSRLAKYFLFLITSSWGIERETINLDELLEIPSPFEGLTERGRQNIASWFDEIYRLSSAATMDEIRISDLGQRIEKEFEKALKLSKRDSIYIHDTLDYNFGIFQMRLNAEGYHRVLISELKKYAEILSAEIPMLLGDNAVNPQITVFDETINDPLQLVVIELGAETSGIRKGNMDSFRDALRTIDRYLFTQHSDSIYFRKTLKYYDENRIYIIKPNQKRFWSQMQAYDDAADIMNDILSM